MDKSTNALRVRNGARPLSLGAALWVALWSACAPTAFAEMYRWVDEDGVTIYSERPPPDAPATVIAPPPQPSREETKRAHERLKAQVLRDYDARQQEAKRSEEQAKKAADQAQRDRNCNAARSNLETIENLGARRLLRPDGTYQRLSDEERAGDIEKMRTAIEENCN